MKGYLLTVNPGTHFFSAMNKLTSNGIDIVHSNGSTKTMSVYISDFDYVEFIQENKDILSFEEL